LLKDWACSKLNPADFAQVSNYELYQQASFNRPEYYPIQQSISGELYRPTHNWLGRLILPTLEERHEGRSVGLEIYHAPQDYNALVGKVVNLRWSDDPEVQSYVQLATYDVHFESQVRLSQRQGNIHPERLNHWQKVDPLESMAGAHPRDDIMVALKKPIEVIERESDRPTILINSDPLHVTGRYCGLVQIREPLGEDRFRVQHYSRESEKFEGALSIVYIPTVVVNRYGILPSSNHQLEQSPANDSGWYIFGTQNLDGDFVVQAIAPYKLFTLQPDQVIRGKKATLKYINFDYWKDIVAQKGTLTKTFLLPDADEKATAPAHLSQGEGRGWHEDMSQIFPEGTRTLLMHLYGGIGGEKPEPAAMRPVFFGHFSYGIAQVVREPLTGKLRLPYLNYN
jgi:predicted Abi (CAAX) family protease